MRRRYALILLGVAWGCAEKDPVGSVHLASRLITVAEGGVLEVSANDDARLAKTYIFVPAGALAQDTLLTIDAGADLVPPRAVAGPSAKFGPQGLSFLTPARIRLPYERDLEPRLMRVRIKHSDGTTQTLANAELEVNTLAKTLEFSVDRFSEFQVTEAIQNSCTIEDCGDAPGVPGWTCEDGTQGGFTGRCLPSVEGCAWEVIWCQRECSASECGAPPQVPSIMCPDGSTAGVGPCTRNMDGVCVWEVTECMDLCEGVTCPPNASCDPQTGQCVSGPVQCGMSACEQGEFCCNQACGTCAPNGEMCPDVECNSCQSPNGGVTICPPGEVCEPTSGECVPDRPTSCGQSTCEAPNVCCNASCGICALPGQGCPQDTCESCGNLTCRPGEICLSNSPPTCGSEMCAPGDCQGNPNDLPRWQCENGTMGGYTGQCINTDYGCDWELIDCPRLCDPMECGPVPAPTDPSHPCGATMQELPPPECRRNADGTCEWRFDCQN